MIYLFNNCRQIPLVNIARGYKQTVRYDSISAYRDPAKFTAEFSGTFRFDVLFGICSAAARRFLGEPHN